MVGAGVGKVNAATAAGQYDNVCSKRRATAVLVISCRKQKRAKMPMMLEKLIKRSLCITRAKKGNLAIGLLLPAAHGTDANLMLIE